MVSLEVGGPEFNRRGDRIVKLLFALPLTLGVCLTLTACFGFLQGGDFITALWIGSAGSVISYFSFQQLQSPEVNMQ